MKTLRRLALALLAAGVALPASASDGYKLVVNQRNPASTLSRSEVARIFLKKVTNWPDGLAVVAIDQERTAAVRAQFSSDVLGKDADAISAHWQVLVFSGRDVPPKILKSDDDVLNFVRANAGAIGYVSPSAPLSGVKVVDIQ